MSTYNFSRRSFLGKSSLVIAGGALLAPELLSATSLKKENEFQISDHDFKETKDLRNSFNLAKSVKVWGTLYAKDGLKPLSNAEVKVWHLSPNSKKYGHFGKFTTNSLGQYCFWTDYPNNELGKFPKIHFYVTKSGKSSESELLIGKDTAHILSHHWERNTILGEEVFPKLKNKPFETTIQFNFTI